MAYTESHIYIAVFVFHCHLRNYNKQLLKTTHKESIPLICKDSVLYNAKYTLIMGVTFHHPVIN